LFIRIVGGARIQEFARHSRRTCMTP
jgi:hypothetical protein